MDIWHTTVTAKLHRVAINNICWVAPLVDAEHNWKLISQQTTTNWNYCTHNIINQLIYLNVKSIQHIKRVWNSVHIIYNIWEILHQAMLRDGAPEVLFPINCYPCAFCREFRKKCQLYGEGDSLKSQPNQVLAMMSKFDEGNLGNIWDLKILI